MRFHTLKLHHLNRLYQAVEQEWSANNDYIRRSEEAGHPPGKTSMTVRETTALGEVMTLLQNEIHERVNDISLSALDAAMRGVITIEDQTGVAIEGLEKVSEDAGNTVSSLPSAWDDVVKEANRSAKEFVSTHPMNPKKSRSYSMER